VRAHRDKSSAHYLHFASSVFILFHAHLPLPPVMPPDPFRFVPSMPHLAPRPSFYPQPSPWGGRGIIGGDYDRFPALGGGGGALGRMGPGGLFLGGGGGSGQMGPLRVGGFSAGLGRGFPGGSRVGGRREGGAGLGPF
jgi:hypothetical protein